MQILRRAIDNIPELMKKDPRKTDKKLFGKYYSELSTGERKLWSGEKAFVAFCVKNKKRVLEEIKFERAIDFFSKFNRLQNISALLNLK